LLFKCLKKSQNKFKKNAKNLNQGPEKRPMQEKIFFNLKFFWCIKNSSIQYNLKLCEFRKIDCY